MTPKAAAKHGRGQAVTAGELVPVPDRSSARKAEYRVKQLTAAERRILVTQLSAGAGE